ncbi:MAG TPA: DNA methyltransferase [Ignavibacteria bacterium]
MNIINHLERQIPPDAHTPMYNWHKYWSRKTWNVVAEFIKTYSPEGGLVFDPFAGSGVTALEALKSGRRVITCDLLPISTEIIRLTIKNVSLINLQKAFEVVEKKVRRKIESLYLTKCRNCGCEFPFTCSIWNQERENLDTPIKRECIDIRYPKCPQCGDRREKNTPPNKRDKELINDIDNKKIKEWYPKNKLYHTNGNPFMKKEKFESIDELFTKRNLQALAWLMEAIEEETNKDIRDFLKIGFTSIVHLCSVMNPISEGGHFTPFSSAWTQHSYWFASGPFMEQNVWNKFESSIKGHQGLLKAKEESNKYYKNIKFANSISDVIEKKADVFIYNGSCFDLMNQMKKNYGDEGIVDYIFTDPPYDASIQYSELAYLWITWLKKDKGFLDKVALDEVIRNERQGKDFNIYHSLLSRSFKDMYDILKPECYLTVTFHNPTFKIRNATIYAGVFAGFEFQKIHHQELARPSAKSLLQPFGSAQGDFYLRFHKSKSGTKVSKPEQIDEKRFENIVVETAIKVIAERNEPTPYTIIINAVDPELAKRGYFSELHTGLDVKTVLQNHLDDEFKLVESKRGGAIGSEWWLKDTNIVNRLDTIPLSERVEQTVLRKLQELVKATFTDIWNAVSIEFPNSHTTDSMSILKALKIFAEPMTKGFWQIKKGLTQNEIEKEHTTMIALLSEIGNSLKYKIWVGKIEQTHNLNTNLINKEGKLNQYLTYKNIRKIKNIQNPDTVERIDLLWIKDDKIIKAFEVESSTSMTMALQRGSNIDAKVKKYMLMPYDRKDQFKDKFKSPLFSERFINDSWNIIYFETFRETYNELKKNLDIDKIIDTKPLRITMKSKMRDDAQVEIFN